MSHRNTVLAVAATACFLLAAVTARGSTITYSDRTAWAAATTGATNINFEGITSTYLSFSTAQGLTIDGVTFIGLTMSTPAYELWVVNPAPGSEHDFGSGSVLKGPQHDPSVLNKTVRVSLPGGVTSFGVDLMSNTPGAHTFTIMLSTGDIFTNVPTYPRPTPSFFGVTTTTAISQIDFILKVANSSEPSPLLDNFAFGMASLGGAGGPEPGAETPEALTLLLVGSGLVMIHFMRRRRGCLAT